MSKFLSKKKRLIEDVYEKASSETTETSFSGIILHLDQVLKDDFEALSYKSFENYYKALVENDEDYKIKPPILDNLSNYLGYDTFKDYCSEWKTIEHTIQQAISKIVITIINKPILAMPDFLKKNGLGILEVTFVLLLVSGGVIFSNTKYDSTDLTNPIRHTFLGKPDIEKNYMYWNGERYVATDSSDLGPQLEIIPMNRKIFKDLKKIIREDTLTIENSKGKVWYDKSDNNVEFFTSYGKHPSNGKALKDVTETILNNYAGENADIIIME